MDYIKEFKFAGDALNGDGGFYSGGEIVKYPREADKKYTVRKELAKRSYYEIFPSKVGRYIGYLFSTPPTTTTQSDIAKVMIDDFNLAKDNFNTFFSTLAKNSKARGVGIVRVGMTDINSSNLADQLKNRELPYAVEILPENITKYSLLTKSEFYSVEYKETIIEVKNGEEVTVEIKRAYDQENEYIINGDTTTTRPHGFNFCPVRIFSEKGAFESKGEFFQIAGLAKDLYNKEAELNDIMRGSTFPLLTLKQEIGSDAADISLGVDNMLAYSGDHPPSYLTPSQDAAIVYENRIQAILDKIDAVAYDVSTTKSQESGIALQIKFQGLNGSLSDFSQRLESFSREVVSMMLNRVGLKSDAVIVKFNTNFNIIDIQAEIESLASIKEIATMPTYEAEKLKKIVTADLGTIDREILDKIYREIEAMQKYTE